MNRTIFSQEYFRPSEDAYAAFEITPTMGQKRIFVMALRGGAPPTANPMHVPGLSHASGKNPAYPRWPAQVLPEDDRVSKNPDTDLYWLRPVGRVVSDAEGRLCELVGRELRPLGRVVRGPQGQLLELLPASETTEDAAGQNIIDGELIGETKDRAASGRERPAAQQKITPQPAAGVDRLRCRRLFADPGLPRVVELGKFRRALAPQLAHPERLRDVHRLACYVQVYEALMRQRADDFLEAIQCAGHQNIAIEPATEESIAALGLQGFLARRPRPEQSRSREPGYVLPFECFYSLRVGSDPTAETVEASKADTSKERNAGPECPPAVPAPANSSPTKAPASCAGIPERFQNPWEFQFGRDEVLYDMNAGAASWGSGVAFFRNLRRWFRPRGEFRRWRALLGAKDLEEQLWAVRPPRGSFSDASVREWACQTLDAAGYDSRVMLREWEIFWRRKGV